MNKINKILLAIIIILVIIISIMIYIIIDLKQVIKDNKKAMDKTAENMWEITLELGKYKEKFGEINF